MGFIDKVKGIFSSPPVPVKEEHIAEPDPVKTEWKQAPASLITKETFLQDKYTQRYEGMPIREEQIKHQDTQYGLPEVEYGPKGRRAMRPSEIKRHLPEIYDKTMAYRSGLITARYEGDNPNAIERRQNRDTNLPEVRSYRDVSLMHVINSPYTVMISDEDHEEAIRGMGGTYHPEHQIYTYQNTQTGEIFSAVVENGQLVRVL